MQEAAKKAAEDYAMSLVQKPVQTEEKKIAKSAKVALKELQDGISVQKKVLDKLQKQYESEKKTGTRDEKGLASMKGNIKAQKAIVDTLKSKLEPFEKAAKKEKKALKEAKKAAASTTTTTTITSGEAKVEIKEHTGPCTFPEPDAFKGIQKDDLTSKRQQYNMLANKPVVHCTVCGAHGIWDNLRGEFVKDIPKDYEVDQPPPPPPFRDDNFREGRNSININVNSPRDREDDDQREGDEYDDNQDIGDEVHDNSARIADLERKVDDMHRMLRQLTSSRKNREPQRGRRIEVEAGPDTQVRVNQRNNTGNAPRSNAQKSGKRK